MIILAIKCKGQGTLTQSICIMSPLPSRLVSVAQILRNEFNFSYAESAHILKAIVEGCITSMPLALEIALHRSGLEIMFRHLDLSDPPLNLFFDQLRSIDTSINPQQVVLIVHRSRSAMSIAMK